MKFSLTSLALFATGALAQLMINTPTGALSAIQCEPFQITWTGGTGPFDVRLLDSAQNFLEEISAAATSSPLLWTVNVAAGSSVIFSIHDSVGASSSSAPFTIQTSSNTACLSASGSTGASSTPASSGSGSATSAPASTTGASSVPPVSSAPVSSSPAATSTAPATSTRPTSASVISSGSPASSSPARTSSAAAHNVVVGGFVGPIVAALLALAA